MTKTHNARIDKIYRSIEVVATHGEVDQLACMKADLTRLEARAEQINTTNPNETSTLAWSATAQRPSTRCAQAT